MNFLFFVQVLHHWPTRACNRLWKSFTPLLFPLWLTKSDAVHFESRRLFLALVTACDIDYNTAPKRENPVVEVE